MHRLSPPVRRRAEYTTQTPADSDRIIVSCLLLYLAVPLLCGLNIKCSLHSAIPSNGIFEAARLLSQQFSEAQFQENDA